MNHHVSKHDWSELERIATPAQWLQMYSNYQEALTHKQLAEFWRENYNKVSSELKQLKERVEPK